jgi:hypothetical protein
VSRRLAWALVLALALGCQTPSYYDEYRASHPDFEAVLPNEGASLEELLAALYAPPAKEAGDLELRRLEILRVDERPWRALSLDEIRRGELVPSDAESYAVVADWECRAKVGLKDVRVVRPSWYLLPDNRLEAWDHLRFRSGCETRSQFRAARGAQAEVEAELSARVAKAYGKRTLELDEVYRRGLAYVEAGRLVEARAMLLLGERGFRAADERLRRQQAPGAGDPLADVRRLRDRLLRALGYEAEPGA